MSLNADRIPAEIKTQLWPNGFPTEKVLVPDYLVPDVARVLNELRVLFADTHGWLQLAMSAPVEYNSEGIAYVPRRTAGEMIRNERIINPKNAGRTIIHYCLVGGIQKIDGAAESYMALALYAALPDEFKGVKDLVLDEGWERPGSWVIDGDADDPSQRPNLVWEPDWEVEHPQVERNLSSSWVLEEANDLALAGGRLNRWGSGDNIYEAATGRLIAFNDTEGRRLDEVVSLIDLALDMFEAAPFTAAAV